MGIEGKVGGSLTKDYTGIRFGQLTAIERLEKDTNGQYFWKVKCDCGKFSKVRTSHLKKI